VLLVVLGGLVTPYFGREYVWAVLGAAGVIFAIGALFALDSPDFGALFSAAKGELLVAGAAVLALGLAGSVRISLRLRADEVGVPSNEGSSPPDV
jgi:membrane associated rhomboid family serine protease